MMNSLNNALEHTLAMTHHMMRGKVFEIEPEIEESEPAWSVVFYTDDDSRPIQELEVEIMIRDGGVVASILNEFNMSRNMVNVFMNLLIGAIVVPDEEPDPDQENDDPDYYETDDE